MLDTSITCKTYSNNINKILPSYTRGGCRNDLNTMLKQKMYAEICPCMHLPRKPSSIETNKITYNIS